MTTWPQPFCLRLKGIFLPHLFYRWSHDQLPLCHLIPGGDWDKEKLQICEALPQPSRGTCNNLCPSQTAPATTCPHQPTPPAVALFSSTWKECPFSFTGDSNSPLFFSLSFSLNAWFVCHNIRVRDGKVHFLSLNTHGFSLSSYFNNLNNLNKLNLINWLIN